MTLSIIGRYNAVDLSSYCVGNVQDPDDLDSMYFINANKLYKFTWPDTLTMLVDLTSYLQNNSFLTAAIAKDVSSIYGELGTDLHYAIAHSHSTPGEGGMRIVDVNLTNLSITTCVPAGYSVGGGFHVHMFIPDTFVAYTELGTVFYARSVISAEGYQWFGKRLGLTSPITQALSLNNVGSIYWVDNAGFHGIGYSDWRVTGLSLSASAAQTPGMYDTPPGAYDSALWGYNYNWTHWPKKIRGWDDNWQYGFGVARTSNGSVFDLWFYRKNVVTLQYQAQYVLAVANGEGGTAVDAFDMWQNDDDVSTRWIYFSHGSANGVVYSSSVWPVVATNYVDVDTGVNVYVHALHTNEQYCYAVHSGGGQGVCITKLMETELITGEAEPSIGGIGARILMKDKRVFFIGVPGYGKYLWWGQPLEPQALDVGWDGFNSTVFDDEDNTSINVLDDNLYIGSQKGFIRLRGKSPDSWVLDQTLATIGPLSDKTSSITPFGLIYPRENGLWLFNGFTSVLFFEKGKNLLNNVNWTEYARAFSLWDGRYYRLYYPSGSSVENDRELVVDLIGGIENARGTEGDRAATFGFADLTTNTVYLGDASGNLMTLGGTVASRAFSLTTKEYPCNGLLNAGSFSALHYDIDLAGATLTIIPICDGVEKAALTITNTTRTRSKVSLPKGNFYRVGFRFEVTTAVAVKFYDPWYLE